MAEGMWRKSFGGARPADEDAQAILDSMPNFTIFKADITRPRNPKFHRLFWAMIRLVYENQDRFDTKAAMMAYLKIGIGHCDTIVFDDGRVAHIPKSISFAKLDEIGFREFFDNVVRFLVERVLPGWNAADLTARVFEMVGEDREDAR